MSVLKDEIQAARKSEREKVIDQIEELIDKLEPDVYHPCKAVRYSDVIEILTNLKKEKP
jgi:hypothetical protein